MEDIPEEISELVPKTLEVFADSKSLEFSRTFLVFAVAEFHRD